jgi:hypothetical protein
MAMGKRKTESQPPLFIVTTDLPRTPAHPFYGRLNSILAEAGFDPFVENLCQKFYRGPLGRPSLAPGMYFRFLLLGYFEGIDSERGIAWRCADSLSLRTSSATRSTRPAPTIRPSAAPAASSTWKPIRTSSPGCSSFWPAMT